VFREYFGTVIPPGDNKFAALNTAVWSGGSFIYVPEGVKVDIPLQAYFRINTENMGQFERTLIIADEGSYVHYVEGCTAPIYSRLAALGGRRDHRQEGRPRPLHDDPELVEQRLQPRHQARRRPEGATMEWIDGNIGSKVTMKYPAVWLTGEHAKGEVLSVAFAGDGQHQDAGAKMVHAAPYTTSNIVSKSISRGAVAPATAAWSSAKEGAHHARGGRQVRRAARRRHLALRHLPLHGRSSRTTRRSARGDRLQGVRRPAVLPAVARHRPRTRPWR
jgi:Fe-S cluster assembly protein SufB